MTAKRLPVALTIAGSDSGGGAGIQADLKTFASLGVHGTSAITCITAQNPTKVSAVEPCTPEMVRAQIEAVFDELPPRAVKTGMLYAPAIVQEVAAFLHAKPDLPLVVDPVMIATSGARLVQNSARDALMSALLPRASLITPNLDETAALLNQDRPNSVEEMRQAARALHAQFCAAVLVKGGHLRGVKNAVDIFYDGRTELLLDAPFVRGVSTHGTGCTYSAAITAYLARGCTLVQSVTLAKDYITQAVAQSYRIGRHYALQAGCDPAGPRKARSGL